MEDRRSLWHIVAVIATLALAVVVAIVAVTRDERGEPEVAASPSPSPSPTDSESPGGLQGEGPYIIYATGQGVGSHELFAFDIASGTSMTLGIVEGRPAHERSRQPGGGRVVAFPTHDGYVWTATRRGLERVGAIPSDAGRGFEGAAVSTDDRKLAVLTQTPEVSIITVDLQSGRPTVFDRTRRGQYPPEPLLPIAWSLGGTVLYEIPWCDCGNWSPGIYALDLSADSSTRLPGTGSESFYRLAVSPSGQALYYGSATERRCRSGEEEPCEGAPFFLRRLAAGRRGSSVLRRATDAPFHVDAISHDGRMLLVRRTQAGSSRLELYNAEGEQQPRPRGIPAGGATGLALLPRDIYVLTGSDAGRSALLIVEGGLARTIVEGGFIYLGWLR